MKLWKLRKLGYLRELSFVMGSSGGDRLFVWDQIFLRGLRADQFFFTESKGGAELLGVQEGGPELFHTCKGGPEKLTTGHHK